MNFYLQYLIFQDKQFNMKIFYHNNWEPYSIMIFNKNHNSFKKLRQELSKWYVRMK